MTRKLIKMRAIYALQWAKEHHHPGVELAAQAILDCVDYHELSVTFLTHMPEYTTVVRVWNREATCSQ
jgi:hypothetical protein